METRYDYSADDLEVDTIVKTYQFTEAIFLKELLGLKEFKFICPYEVLTKMLKELASELAKPLSTLFQTSFETGDLPADWKSTWITPLYKDRSRVPANSYRPVSLSAICSKIMEKIINQQLLQFLEHNYLLSEIHHGLRRGPVLSPYTHAEVPELGLSVVLVHNLSSHRLTQQQLVVLSYDAKFNTRDARPEDFIASFESALQKCDAGEECKNAMRHQVANLLLQHQRQTTISKAE
ncbi:unnamed protein product [Schistocephalus solidus]|uniref:Uncharacterized protein n=1 Tax=Schistocephalus solidus TaxID=70667 RepID=A0A183SWV7_SCHSO|nr:unnamed protein product [Schistocephalus solidus]